MKLPGLGSWITVCRGAVREPAPSQFKRGSAAFNWDQGGEEAPRRAVLPSLANPSTRPAAGSFSSAAFRTERHGNGRIQTVKVVSGGSADAVTSPVSSQAGAWHHQPFPTARCGRMEDFRAIWQFTRQTAQPRSILQLFWWRKTWVFFVCARSKHGRLRQSTPVSAWVFLHPSLSGCDVSGKRRGWGRLRNV